MIIDAGRTPLHFAVSADAQRVFHVLLRNRQTNINEKAHDGTTAMILAVRMATEGMVEELIQSKVAYIPHPSLCPAIYVAPISHWCLFNLPNVSIRSLSHSRTQGGTLISITLSCCWILYVELSFLTLFHCHILGGYECS